MFPEPVFQVLGRKLVGWPVSVGSGVGVAAVLAGPETRLVELE
jgi:hypothetical protein